MDQSTPDKPAESPHPNFFLIGCQKTASTWLHRCFREHPDIYVPSHDGIHYFTINYHRGTDWYRRLFDEHAGEAAIGETTPSYYRMPIARQRLAAFNPDAKLLMTLRNPIERAFSHYWHEKKKRTIAWSFEDVLGNNVDLFESWIATGFYHHHIQELLRLFPREQLCVMLYDDLIADPRAFCREVFTFLGVDAGFEPSILGQHANKAWYRPTLTEMARNVSRGRPPRESEYERGMATELREELRAIFRPDIEQLSDFLDRDLSAWR